MNPILTIPEMIALEEQAFREGVDPWELMQQAGREMARAIRQRFPEPGFCRVFAGRGNNAGDAWVVARLLDQAGWTVSVECPFAVGKMSLLAQKAVAAWINRALSLLPKISETSPQSGRHPLVVVDGLLGIGVRGECRSPIREAIVEINRLRKHGAVVFALDLPSGLGTDLCVEADHTLTVGFAKDVLLHDSANANVGRISVLPLPELAARKIESSSSGIITSTELRSILPPRPFAFHKGQAGRVLLIAGSRGMIGAAVLAATGVLRGGAGIVRLVCPPEVFPSLTTLAPPEVMVLPWNDLPDRFFEQTDVLAIGPGLDPSHDAFIWPIISAARVPLLLDAGGLSILSNHLPELKTHPSSILLTPHPGEMKRLFPQENRTRAEWASDFLAIHGSPKTTVLLKGSRTVIASASEPITYNSTGHPGMATGGMGDTLTGVCAALLAQKLTPHQSACAGAWVCGRAAEIALELGSESQESLVASDVSRHLGRAFADLRAEVF